MARRLQRTTHKEAKTLVRTIVIWFIIGLLSFKAPIFGIGYVAFWLVVIIKSYVSDPVKKAMENPEDTWKS